MERLFNNFKLQYICYFVACRLPLCYPPLTRGYLKTLYNSFIYPYYTYCNHVWGSACMTTLNSLVLLQKRIIRIITVSKRLSHTDPLFRELGLLKLQDVNKFMIGKFMFRWYHNDLPNIFYDKFEYVRNVHGYGTRQRIIFIFPKLRLNEVKIKLLTEALSSGIKS